MDPGADPGVHQQGPAKQEGPRRQSGIDNVGANAAEELLDHDNGKKVTDENGPIGERHRADEGHQDARYHGRQVAGGVVLFHQPPVGPLEENAGRHGEHGQRQRPGAEEHHRAHQGRKQRQAHVQHNTAGGIGGMGVRRGGERQIQGFRVHFAASFAFAAASRSSRLAVRKLCTRGMPAGQP